MENWEGIEKGGRTKPSNVLTLIKGKKSRKRRDYECTAEKYGSGFPECRGEGGSMSFSGNLKAL